MTWYWLSGLFSQTGRPLHGAAVHGPGGTRAPGVARAARDVELAGLALRVAFHAHRAEAAAIGEADLRTVDDVRSDDRRRVEQPVVVAALVDVHVDPRQLRRQRAAARPACPSAAARGWPTGRASRPARASASASARARRARASGVGLGFGVLAAVGRGSGVGSGCVGESSEPQPAAKQASGHEPRCDGLAAGGPVHRGTVTRRRGLSREPCHSAVHLDAAADAVVGAGLVVAAAVGVEQELVVLVVLAVARIARAVVPVAGPGRPGPLGVGARSRSRRSRRRAGPARLPFAPGSRARSTKPIFVQ